MATSAMRTMAAFEASGVDALSSWLRRARRRCDVLEGWDMGVGCDGLGLDSR